MLQKRCKDGWQHVSLGKTSYRSFCSKERDVSHPSRLLKTRSGTYWNIIYLLLQALYVRLNHIPYRMLQQVWTSWFLPLQYCTRKKDPYLRLGFICFRIFDGGGAVFNPKALELTMLEEETAFGRNATRWVHKQFYIQCKILPRNYLFGFLDRVWNEAKEFGSFNWCAWEVATWLEGTRWTGSCRSSIAESLPYMSIWLRSTTRIWVSGSFRAIRDQWSILLQHFCYTHCERTVSNHLPRPLIYRSIETIMENSW